MNVRDDLRSALLRAALPVLLLVPISGCANTRVGQPLPVAQIQELREGFTNRDRVLSLFGEPLRKVPGENGEIWIYRYMDGKQTSQELVVSFTGGVVSTFSHQ